MHAHHKAQDSEIPSSKLSFADIAHAIATNNLNKLRFYLCQLDIPYFDPHTNENLLHVACQYNIFETVNILFTATPKEQIIHLARSAHHTKTNYEGYELLPLDYTLSILNKFPNDANALKIFDLFKTVQLHDIQKPLFEYVGTHNEIKKRYPTLSPDGEAAKNLLAAAKTVNFVRCLRLGSNSHPCGAILPKIRERSSKKIKFMREHHTLYNLVLEYLGEYTVVNRNFFIYDLALTFGVGNCYEFAAVGKHYLSKLNPPITAKVTSFVNSDHTFLYWGENQNQVFCDPWGGVFFSAHECEEKLMGYRKYEFRHNLIIIQPYFNSQFHIFRDEYNKKFKFKVQQNTLLKINLDEKAADKLIVQPQSSTHHCIVFTIETKRVEKILQEEGESELELNVDSDKRLKEILEEDDDLNGYIAPSVSPFSMFQGTPLQSASPENTQMPAQQKSLS